MLCLEDSRKDVEIMKELLLENGFQIELDWTATEKEFRSLLQVNKYDIIISDFRLPGFDAFTALRISAEISPSVPFICVSGSIGEETAIELIRQGAVDYILKDRLGRLPSALKRALDEASERRSRRRAEEALSESEQKYRLLFESSLDAVLLTSPGGEIFSANPAACKMLMRTEEEICRLGRGGLVDKNDPRVVAALEERARSGRFSGELTMMRGDGTIFPAEVTTSVFKDKENRERTSMIVRDITERKESEKVLHKSEQNFRFLFYNNPLPMWVYDLESLSYLAVNEAAVAKYGYTREKFLSMTIKDIRPKEDVGKLLDHLAQGRPTLQSSGGWRHKLKNGKVIDVEIVSYALEYDNHKAALVVVQDVTERLRAEKALKNSEEKYRGIFENVHDVYFETTIEGTIVEVSPSIEIVSAGQYRPADLIGRSIYEFYDDVGVRRQLIGLLNERGTVSDFEVKLKNKDGSLVPCSISSRIHLDSEKKPRYVVGTMRDITERKWAEEKLRESESRMRLIVEGTPHMFFYTQALDAKLTYVSPSVEKITGHPVSEWYNQTDWFTTKNKINDYAKERTRAHLSGEFSLEPILVEIEHADKHLIMLEVYENPIKVDGKVVGIQGIAHDITERTTAENELRKLSQAVEQSPASIVITDLGGKIVYVNPKFSQLTGFTPEEAIGQNPRILKSGELPSEEYRELWEAITSGKEWRGEFHNKKKNGELYWEIASISPIRDSSGAITHFLAVKEDITEKKSLESQLLRSQRLESIGTLAGGIAHDLNNVLAPILLAVDILKKSAVDERNRKMVSALESSAQRGAAIVKQILGFARGMQGERVVIQFRHIINEIGNIIRETFPRSISIKESISKNLWTVVGDPTNLHQLMLNLCVNARDAMPDGGSISIKAENKTLDKQYSEMNLQAKPGRYVVVSVEDTGCGIPPAVQERIFEPFFTTKEIGKGTGLGLSTVHAIVKSHGGFINLYSEEGKGTIFRVYLPAAKGTAETTDQSDTHKEMLQGQGQLILIVDDETSIQQITKSTLEAYGYRAVTASDGAEAISQFALKRGEISLVLTDMMMPLMDGLQTIKALRVMDPNIKIIASSGLTTGDNVWADKRFGVNAFLTKPYDAFRLLKTVYSVINGLDVD